MMEFFKGSFTLVALGAQLWPRPVMQARGVAKQLIEVALTSSNRIFRLEKHLSWIDLQVWEKTRCSLLKHCRWWSCC